MGCIQSKPKNKELPNGNDGNGHLGHARTDAVKPEDQSSTRVPTKHAHAYNDDPLVRGRADSFPDIKIEDKENELNENKADGQNSNEIKTNIGEHIERKAEIKPEPSANKNQESQDGLQITPKDIATEHEKTTEKKQEGNSVVTNDKTIPRVQTDETTEQLSKKKETNSDIQLPSVFIPDESFDSAQNKDVYIAASSDNSVVDVNDISIGQAVGEVEVKNETVNINGETVSKERGFIRPKADILNDGKKSGEKSIGIYTAEENNEQTSEKRNSADSAPSVRYQSKDKVVYGLPEGVPKPAPPKTKKADIITPNAFTIADKIVDQTPDKGFASITKLASYLTGESKKSDLETNDDEAETSTKNLPPLTPVKTKKKDIVPNVNMFKKIDDNARKTPESVRMSVDKLVAHLCKPATSDLDKVRAFYFWICHNIRYVYEDKEDASRLRFDAVSTLRQGKGSYVNLMSAFCKEVDIPVVTIPGCSKGLRHQPDKEFAVGEHNHSWNAVHINGEWRFLDCTWGSGFLDVNRKFHHQFDEFWFLTDPEVHAYDHFPAHPSWQLLEEPIDIDEFNKKPSLTERSRELGFKLISHKEPMIYVQNEVTITFGTDTYPLSNITADFRNEDGGEVNRHRCMCKIDEKTFEIRVVPPESGNYILILYGKARDYRHTKYRKLMEYSLCVETVYPEKVIFPKHLKTWGPEPNYAEYGFTDTIQNLSVFKADSNEMTITLEQSRKNMISPELKASSDDEKDLEDFTMLTANERGIVVHVRFPKSGFYRLDIYAVCKTEKLEYCASFLLECKMNETFETPKCYPKYNADSVSKHVCELLEPKHRELPANTVVTFRLASPALKQAMLGVPMDDKYGSRLTGLGELNFTGSEFRGQIKTPKKGDAIYLSGSAAPPNVLWSRIYEFVSV